MCNYIINKAINLQVGHMVKLGLSTRNYILQGPTDDEEPESELSITELKEKRLKDKLAAELLEKQRIELEEMEEERRRKKEEEDGIDWGMGLLILFYKSTFIIVQFISKIISFSR